MNQHSFIWVIIFACLTTIYGCGTSRNVTSGTPGATLAGASIGGNIGGMMGGLIGENRHGWHGGYRGSAIGSIVGTVAGAVIGNAVSRNKVQEESMATASQEEGIYSHSSNIEQLRIQKIRFIDDNRDHIICSGEHSKVIFEIINEGHQPATNIVPIVEETTGTKRIHISPPILVEKINPHKGVKYTATVTAGKRIKTGKIVLRVAVADDTGQQYDWQEFTIPTQR
ncbi:MAG TPA: glycine zipper family protein [Candidatus Bacteroides merdipullorum]|uniref:Glycine zipper family protein n=1 Tax=Candidatus Bacteroides merdipullorum TaxID=2838474 RepID=A0A9D2A347_9BACE|nr:glycine zipper family protein [Candidatus Bacteroides merdipullorum]